MSLEEDLDEEIEDVYLEKNKPFVKCDFDDCYFYGKFRRCYFDIYLQCKYYKPYLENQ